MKVSGDDAAQLRSTSNSMIGLVHNPHATFLHLFDIEHIRLRYDSLRRDFRLTVCMAKWYGRFSHEIKGYPLPPAWMGGMKRYDSIINPAW